MDGQEDAIAWAEAAVGQTIDGRYQLEKVLGAGGMGAVFEAYDQSTDSFVAIKLVLPAVAANTDGIARFHREAQSASRAGAKGVAQVLAVGSDAALGPFIVMECLIGETLVDRLRRERGLEAATTVVIVRDLLEALAVVHAQGIIHRDLKPGNVFLVEDQERMRVKIVDFGVCRVDQKIARTMLTAPGEVLGTPHYMSPEQAAGKSDERADLYSVGAIAYSCLAGRPPYAEAVGMAAVARLVVEPPTPLRRIVPQLDELLLWVVERAMARNPDERFSTADEMLEALERFEVDATRVDHRMEDRVSVDDIPDTARHAVAAKTEGMVVAHGIDPTAFDEEVETVAQLSSLGLSSPALSSPAVSSSTLADDGMSSPTFARPARPQPSHGDSLPASPFAPAPDVLAPRRALPASPFASGPAAAPHGPPSPRSAPPPPPRSAPPPPPRSVPPPPRGSSSAAAPEAWPAPPNRPAPAWAPGPPGVSAPPGFSAPPSSPPLSAPPGVQPARVSSGPRVQAFQAPPIAPVSHPPPPRVRANPHAAVAPTALMPASAAPPFGAAAPHSPAPHSPAPHSPAPHSPAPHSPAPHFSAPYSAAPHSPAPYSAAPHSGGPPSHASAPAFGAPPAMAPGYGAPSPHPAAPMAAAPHAPMAAGAMAPPPAAGTSSAKEKAFVLGALALAVGASIAPIFIALALHFMGVF